MEQPEFNWLEIEPIIPDKGIIIHYTPRWPLMLHYICAICCFGFSAVYHLFNSHSKKTMTFWIRFDYAGICLMIAGSSTSPIYYSFACEQLQEWRFFYLGFIYLLCTLTLICMLIPYFDKEECLKIRGCLFLFTGLSNLLPIFHIVYVVDPQYLHYFHVEPWLLGGLLYVVGTMFYLYKVPESCCKHNQFDIIGNSHQIFHICILLAALAHYYGSVQVFHDRQINSCPLSNIII